MALGRLPPAGLPVGMTPANSSPTRLTLLTGLALLGPIGVLAWQAPRAAPVPQEESVEAAFAPPLPREPAVPPAARSSLLVAKVKDPALRPAGLGAELLTDAPNDDMAGTLTGTLAEIEARLAQERAPRPPRVVRPRAGRGLPRCMKTCRAERTLCVGRRRGASNACRSAYAACAAACRDSRG